MHYLIYKINYYISNRKNSRNRKKTTKKIFKFIYQKNSMRFEPLDKVDQLLPLIQ